MKGTLWFDGSNSVKMDRPASWGYILEIEGRDNIEGQGICKAGHGEIVYKQSNNLGEYSGLCHGLMRARLEGVTDVHIKGDSQLVLYQMTGKYKVNRKKYPHLGILHDAAQNILKKFDKFTMEWIDQTKNKADDVSRVRGKIEGIQRSKKIKGKITHEPSL